MDILTGGFPCQPFSFAGQRKGKKDLRFLWPEMLRVINEIRPRWVLGENVPGIVNMALEEVCASLEKIGYEVWPIIIPAAGVGAVHQRARVWIIAYASGKRFKIHNREQKAISKKNRIKPSVTTRTSARSPYWKGWPTESPVHRAVDGLPGRMDAIKSLGNAIHTGVAFEIFSLIQKIEAQ